MIKDTVNILRNIFLRHKGIRTFKYQGRIYNNAQPNDEPFQVFVDDISYHEMNITNDIFTSKYEIYILSSVMGEDDDVLAIQDQALTVAVDVIKHIEESQSLRMAMKVHDYSILTLSHFSDNDSCGVKLSIELEMPNPINLCEYEDNFNEEPYEPKEEDVDICERKTDDDDLIIRTIHLPIR